MQTICYWTKRAELAQMADSFSKEVQRHKSRTEKLTRAYTICLGALLAIEGVVTVGCLIYLLVCKTKNTTFPPYFIGVLIASICFFAIGLLLFRIRPVANEFPWPAWYAQYLLDENRLEMLLSGKPVKVNLVDERGYPMPECEAYQCVADFDSRRIFLLVRTRFGSTYGVATSLDDMSFVPKFE